jgi:hypothetical protein
MTTLRGAKFDEAFDELFFGAKKGSVVEWMK